MAKKMGKELTDEQIIRVARLRTTETVASTFKQSSIDTQLSVERGVIWMIHWIEFELESIKHFLEVATSGTDSVQAQVTRESKTSILTPDDNDVIQRATRYITRFGTIGTEAGPETFVYDPIVKYEFPIPLPYASQSIYLGVAGTHASLFHTVTARVGYTIREVSDKFFFRIAQSLVG